MVSCVPLAVLLLGSTRSVPEVLLTKVPSERSVQNWLASPSQDPRAIRVPAAVPAFWGTKQLPKIRRVPSGSTVQSFSAASAMHCQIWILVPLAVPAPASLMHKFAVVSLDVMAPGSVRHH